MLHSRDRENTDEMEHFLGWDSMKFFTQEVMKILNFEGEKSNLVISVEWRSARKG